MKRLLMVIIVGFQSIIFSAALAWSPLDVSPLDVLEPAAQSTRLCYSTIAASEQEQEDLRDPGRGLDNFQHDVGDLQAQPGRDEVRNSDAEYVTAF